MPNPNVEVTVAVSKEFMDRISEVIQNLQSAGMNVERSLEKLGIIVGTVDPTKVGVLSQVEGVSSVERSQKIQLPSPEKEVQ